MIKAIKKLQKYKEINYNWQTVNSEKKKQQ